MAVNHDATSTLLNVPSIDGAGPSSGKRRRLTHMTGEIDHGSAVNRLTEIISAGRTLLAEKKKLIKVLLLESPQFLRRLLGKCYLSCSSYREAQSKSDTLALSNIYRLCYVMPQWLASLMLEVKFKSERLSSPTFSLRVLPIKPESILSRVRTSDVETMLTAEEQREVALCVDEKGRPPLWVSLFPLLSVLWGDFPVKKKDCTPTRKLWDLAL